jgi:hypothetical protein
MQTRSGKTYGETRYSQQQRDDALFDLVDKFNAMSKRVEFMWEHLFPQTEGLGDREKSEKEVDEGRRSAEDSESPQKKDEQLLHPIPHFTTRHNPDTHVWDYHPRPRQEPSPYREHLPIHGYRHDDITKRVRVDVADFHGKLDPHAFQDWLTSLEDYFNWYSLSPDRKVRLVKMKLKGQARMWWDRVEEYHHRLRLPPINDWEEMKLKMQEKFLPMDYEDSVFAELLALKQGSLSIDDYTHRFHELTIRSRLIETERQSLTRYKSGLRDDISRELITTRLTSVDEAYQLAMKLEQQTRWTGGRRASPGWIGGSSKNTYASAPKGMPAGERTFQKGPVMADRAPINKGEGRGRIMNEARGEKGGGECYSCGGRGHYAFMCPSRDQRQTLCCEERPTDDGEQHKDDHREEDDEDPEEVLEPSDRPLCVIRRILTGHKMEEVEGDEWLRTNIFHTRVEHCGKALNMIIDNGSGMNVISVEAVQKLKLPTEKHPKPYKVSWVDDTTIPVKQRCLVNFSLGKSYNDAVWCDIIPMRACHVLLGRPWLFDRKVQYDGHRNTYAFTFGGKRLVLKPMKIQEFESPNGGLHVAER